MDGTKEREAARIRSTENAKFRGHAGVVTDDAPVATVAMASLAAHEQQEFACVNSYRGFRRSFVDSKTLSTRGIPMRN